VTISGGAVREQPNPAGPSREIFPLAHTARVDAWPHTTRVLPWFIASFIGMLYLIPFDATAIPISLPVDSRLDRLALIALAAAWLIAAFADAPSAPRMRRSPMDYLLVLVTAVFAVSLALNLPTLAQNYELALALKKLSLLGSYTLFFYIVSTSVHAREVSAFVSWILLLASFTALGILVEYRTGANYFYGWTQSLLPGLHVGQPPTSVEAFERRAIVGPTHHGLAACTLLGLALPFAVVRMMSRRGWERVAYAAMIVLLIAGGLATQRKTAVMLPLVALLVLIAVRPRAIARFWPMALVVAVATQISAPGAISGIRYQLRTALTSDSTSGRTNDYAAVLPDIKADFLFGRGFGSYDPKKYRILDNQLLDMVIEVGVIGALAWILMILGSALAVRALVRGPDVEAADIGVAVMAAAAVFLTSNVLYDAFSFRHAPYAFMLVAALGVTTARTVVPAAQVALSSRASYVSSTRSPGAELNRGSPDPE